MKSFIINRISRTDQLKIKNRIYKTLRKKKIIIRKISSSDYLIPDLRKDLNLCLFLENILKEYIFKIFPKKSHKNLSLQFPVNIRFFYKAKAEKISHDYSTNILHSDVWSGAPENIRNFIYYVKISKKTSYCKLFKSIKGNKKYEKYRGKYSNSPLKEDNLKEIKYKKQNGLLLSFDPFCPHYTFYPNNSNELRISLDFRVKSNLPYYENKKLMKKKKFVSSKIGQPGLGYYWVISKKKFKNVKEKIQEELKISKNISINAYKLRRLYLKNKKELNKYL